MMKKMILVSMVLNYSIFGAFGLGTTPQYSNAALNTAYQGIQQKAIDVSTAEVASRAGTETDVVQCFEEEFLTDAEQDAPISEKRKMQRAMGLIRAVGKMQTVSGLSLEASDLHETVALDFYHKEINLEAEKAGLWTAKLGWTAVTVASVGAILVASQMDKRDSSFLVVGGIGGIGSAVGVPMLVSTMGKEEKLTTHIAQVQTMKNRWEESFTAQK